MTRPHITEHSAPGRALRYDARARNGRSSEFIGGTLIWEGPPQTIARLNSLVVVNEEPNPWLHVTLSLAEDLVLSLTAWEESFQVMLNALRLPALQVPWVAWRHAIGAQGGIDHAHGVVGKQTFGGRTLELGSLKARCDEADIALRHHLGLPLGVSPHFVKLPRRRQKTSAQKHIAQTIDAVLRHDQPDTFSALRGSLHARGGVAVAFTPNKHGVPSYSFSVAGAAPVRGKTLSDDLMPKMIATWFARFGRLRKLRIAWDCSNLLKALAPWARTLSDTTRRIEEIANENRNDAHRALDGRIQEPAEAASRPDTTNRSDRHGHPGDGGTASGSSAAGGQRNHVAWRALDGSVVGRGDRNRPEHAPAGGPGESHRALGVENDRTARLDGSAATGSRQIARGVARRGLAPHARLVLPAFRLAGKLGLAARIEVSQSNQSLRIMFKNQSALDLCHRGLRLVGEARPGSHVTNYIEAFVVMMDWEAVEKNTGWPFTAPKGPGDLVAAPKPELTEYRARRLRSAQIELLSNSAEVDQRVKLQLDRFMAAGQMLAGVEDSEREKEREVLLFVTGASLGNSENIIQQQIRALSVLGSRHPGMRAVFPQGNGASLGSTSLAMLRERLLQHQKTLVARRKEVEQLVRQAKDPSELKVALGADYSGPAHHGNETTRPAKDGVNQSPTPPEHDTQPRHQAESEESQNDGPVF